MKVKSMMPADNPRSSMSVRLHSKHGKFMPKNAKVGGKHAVRILGRISGLRSDDFGHSIDMDVDDMSYDGDEPTSLTKALKARHNRRQIKSGRYV